MLNLGGIAESLIFFSKLPLRKTKVDNCIAEMLAYAQFPLLQNTQPRSQALFSTREEIRLGSVDLIVDVSPITSKVINLQPLKSHMFSRC